MQSSELSYARYQFYNNKGINIDINNYKLIFTNQKSFIKNYGIDNKELKIMYPFSYYLNTLKQVELEKVLHIMNPNASTLIDDEIIKYIDANSTVEKRIDNNYERVLFLKNRCVK